MVKHNTGTSNVVFVGTARAPKIFLVLASGLFWTVVFTNAYRRSVADGVSILNAISTTFSSGIFWLFLVVQTGSFITAFFDGVVFENDALRIRRWFWRDKVIRYDEVNEILTDSDRETLHLKLIDGQVVEIPPFFLRFSLKKAEFGREIVELLEQRSKLILLRPLNGGEN